MNFEKIGSGEKSVRLILEAVTEQLADDLKSEVVVLSQDTDSFVFQPFLIPEIGSPQRVGPSLEFIESFVRNMVARLEMMHPDVNWEEGLKIQTSPEGIVTIRVGYNELNG